MHVAAAELLGADLLPGRRLDQRRAAEEDRALLADDHGLVAHRRHVGAAGGAGAHHGADLRDAALRHRRLVEEDPAEVLAVGEDLVLHRQEGAAGVDQVDAGQLVVKRDLLGPQVLLDAERVVGAALDRRVVGDDHAAPALDHADSADHAGAGRVAVVELLGGERRELEERGAGIAEQLDPLARGQLAARAMALHRALAATAPHALQAPLEIGDQLLVSGPVAHPILLVSGRLIPSALTATSASPWET